MDMSASFESLSARVLKILIVDDDVYGTDALALLLTMLGHIAHVATSAADALGSFDDLQPDLCLIEIGISDGDGYQLARSLRTRPHGQHSCLVALTGYGSAEDVRASLAAGFDHHVMKPVSIERMSQLFAGARHRATADVAYLNQALGSVVGSGSTLDRWDLRCS
jgi:CheY-like chemotaxis protein